MTQDEIIEMAREAGFNHHHNPDLYDCMIASYKAIESFAKLVAAKAIAGLESQEPVAYLVLFENSGKLLEFKKGNYIHGAKVEHIPLYVKPQIEVGCAECGINGGHALYCVACTEKFDVVVSKAVEHEREECAGIDIPVTVPNRDYLDMSPLEIYEEALMDATLSFRAAIRARKNTHPPQRTEQEPVAWLEPEWREKICPEVGYEVTMTDDHPRDLCWIPLYATPPTAQRTWVGLTDEEVESYWGWEDFQCGCGKGTLLEMVRDIEAKLKERNT